MKAPFIAVLIKFLDHGSFSPKDLNREDLRSSVQEFCAFDGEKNINPPSFLEIFELPPSSSGISTGIIT